MVPVMEHVFSYKPQTVIAHLLRFGAVTRDGVRGVPEAGSLPDLLGILTEILITRLRPVGLLFNLLSGVFLT